MQGLSPIFKRDGYIERMPAGRPAAKPRPVLGEQIAKARREKNLTQKDLADMLEVTQRVITYWEREPVALKPEQLSALADALGEVDDEARLRVSVVCTRCALGAHEADANYCRRCGERLPPQEDQQLQE